MPQDIFQISLYFLSPVYVTLSNVCIYVHGCYSMTLTKGKIGSPALRILIPRHIIGGMKSSYQLHSKSGVGWSREYGVRVICANKSIYFQLLKTFPNGYTFISFTLPLFIYIFYSFQLFSIYELTSDIYEQKSMMML